jgi:hypothetical protein
MIYIPANENICGDSEGLEVTYVAGRGYTGSSGRTYMVPNADHVGEVQAWDVDTGKKVWTHMYPNSMNWGPMLATAGGLVFSGGTNDRVLHSMRSPASCLWFLAISASRVNRGVLQSMASSTLQCNGLGVDLSEYETFSTGAAGEFRGFHRAAWCGVRSGKFLISIDKWSMEHLTHGPGPMVSKSLSPAFSCGSPHLFDIPQFETFGGSCW